MQISKQKTVRYFIELTKEERGTLIGLIKLYSEKADGVMLNVDETKLLSELRAGLLNEG